MQAHNQQEISDSSTPSPLDRATVIDSTGSQCATEVFRGCARELCRGPKGITITRYLSTKRQKQIFCGG